MKFTVPASVTIAGWIEVEADTLEQAKVKCAKLCEEGIDTDQLNDHDFHSVVYTSQCEIMNGDEAEPIELRQDKRIDPAGIDAQWVEPDDEND